MAGNQRFFVSVKQNLADDRRGDHCQAHAAGGEGENNRLGKRPLANKCSDDDQPRGKNKNSGIIADPPREPQTCGFAPGRERGRRTDSLCRRSRRLLWPIVLRCYRVSSSSLKHALKKPPASVENCNL